MADYTALRTTMVDTQIRPSDVTKFPIIAAMLQVPRERFVPNDLRDAAYAGEMLNLGQGRALLEPRDLAKMLDGLNIQSDELVLDVGCTLGYSTAVISKLSETVVALEQDPVMAAEAERLLGETGFDNAAVIQGELAAGAAKHGPYDVIAIQGGVETIPQALIDQLKDGGRIGAFFIEGSLGTCRFGHKSDGTVSWRFGFNGVAPVFPGFDKKPEFAL